MKNNSLQVQGIIFSLREKFKMSGAFANNIYKNNIHFSPNQIKFAYLSRDKNNGIFAYKVDISIWVNVVCNGLHSSHSWTHQVNSPEMYINQSSYLKMTISVIMQNVIFFSLTTVTWVWFKSEIAVKLTVHIHALISKNCQTWRFYQPLFAEI